MALLSIDTEEARTYAQKFEACSKKLRDDAQCLKDVGVRLQSNETLSEYGYDEMAIHESTKVFAQAAVVKQLADLLLKVVEMYEESDQKAIAVDYHESLDAFLNGDFTSRLGQELTVTQMSDEDRRAMEKGDLLGAVVYYDATGEFAYFNRKTGLIISGTKEKGKGANFGIGAEVEGTRSFAHGEAKAYLGQDGMLYIEATGDVYTTTGGFKGTAQLINDGAVQVGLNLEEKLTGSAAKGEVTATYGTKYFNIFGGMRGDVATAEVTGNVTANVDKVEAGFSAEAHAAKGELFGGVTVAGTKVTVKGSASAASFGGGAKMGYDFEAKKGGVKGEIEYLAGVGGEIEVDFSGSSELIKQYQTDRQLANENERAGQRWGIH